jgi:glucuronoarabinoxylan endo-1,4-beta-xylanase
MKKLIFIVCIMLVTTVLSVAPSYGADVELLTNPGFESGTTGWAGRSCTLNAYTGFSHSGTTCGQGTGRTATWMGVKQSLLGKLTNGATYTISGWVRISSASDTVLMSIEQGDGAGTAYPNIATGTATNTGWIQLSGTFTLNVTGTLTTLDIYFEGPASGVDIFVDDASVYGPGVSTSAIGQVNTTIRHQTLEGFGAAGGWYESNLLNNPSKTTLYDLLFTQLGLDFYRYRNTYQIDSGYTDRTAQIIKEVKASYATNLKTMVAAWSPPASLKSNGNTREGTLLKNSSGAYMYTEYAQWWYDSLADLVTRGITPDFVSIQNEPDYTNSGWDTCVLKSVEDTSYAGYNKCFQAVYGKISSSYKLIGPDTANFTNSKAYIDALTATDKSHLTAYCHHLYGDIISDMSTYAATYNDKPRFMTEYSTYITSGQSTFDDAMNLAVLMDASLVNEEVSAYVYWELFWTGSSGLISVESSSYTIRPVYYAFKQFSRYVDTGWQRMEATVDSLNLKIEAYINPSNNQLTVILINSSTTAMTLDLSNLGGFTPSSGTMYRTSSSENCANIGSFNRTTPLSLPARTITTIVMTGTLSGTTTTTTTATTTTTTAATTTTTAATTTTTTAATTTTTAATTTSTTATTTTTTTATSTTTTTATTTSTTAATTTTTAGTTTTTTAATTTTTAGTTTTTATGQTCSPVDAAITAPFTKEGAGTFCWTATACSYINSWNLTTLTVNGVNFTNTYASSSQLPAKIDGNWYIYYNGSYGWSHFELK